MPDAYPIFVALDATALEAGRIYIGAENTDPELSPINVYWDDALTVLATQPLLTSGGVIVRDGTPAQVYASSQSYSIRVRDRSGSVVWYKPVAGGSTVSTRLTFPIPTGPASDVPGPADNTYSFLATFKASDISRKTASLVGVAGVSDGRFNWTLGNFTGQADDINVIKADSTSLTVGAWVRSKAVGFSFQANGGVTRSVQAKLGDVVSVLDLGVTLGDTVSQSTALQSAIDKVAAAGGGTLEFPAGTYRLATAVNLKPKVRLRGVGSALIHWVNNATGNAFQAIGASSAPLGDIHVEGLTIYGDATFSVGVPTVLNGSAFNFQFVSNSSVRGCTITGFADNAVAFANGDLNVIDGVTADQCGQSLAIYGTTRGGYGNKVINSTVTRNGTFNAIHSEGRAAGGTQDVLGTQFLNNTVDDSYGHCINGENSPGIVIAGNRVRKAGPGVESDLIHGIFLFGSPNSTVNGNVSTDNVGRGILIGPNCGNVSINGNTTSNNTGGSCLLTDGGGVAASNNVAIGFNAFGEGPVVQSGNVSVRNLTPSIQFTNTPNVDPLTLDWYEEGVFTPVIVGTTSAGSGTYTAQAGRFTRIGNVVNLWITIGWSSHTGTGNMRLTGLPYVNNAAVKSTLELAPNGLALPANSTLHTVIIEGQSYIDFYTHQPTAGDQTMLPMDSAVPEMTLAGAYRA